MRCILWASALAVAVSTTAATAAPLFMSTFDSAASSSDFNVTQVAGSTDVITFGYDYSVKSIPEAPSSPGTSTATRGLFLQANKPPAPATAGNINGINVTPAAGGVSLSFSGDINATFDLWLGVSPTLVNTTEQALFGINTDGLGVNSRTGAAQSGADGVWYHMASDGGYGNTSTTANSRDVVGYINNSVPTGARLDNSEAPFPALFPTGVLVGAPSNQWMTVLIRESGGAVELRINGTTVFNFANTGPADGSIFIGYQDPFSGSLASAETSFAVYDNLVVNQVPEPASMLLGLGGAMALFAVRRRA